MQTREEYEQSQRSPRAQTYLSQSAYPTHPAQDREAYCARLWRSIEGQQARALLGVMSGDPVMARAGQMMERQTDRRMDLYLRLCAG